MALAMKVAVDLEIVGYERVRLSPQHDTAGLSGCIKL
jgi:hypothetical protein